MPKTISAIVASLMALSYSLMGILLFIYPDSAFTERFLPNYRWAYYLGALLIIYGGYRVWRVYKKLKDEDDDDYEYYDGSKG